jgi:hypothetical protein
LFIASNPRGTKALSLEEEFRDIAVRLKVDGLRERVRLLPRLAARSDDLMEGLLEEEPDVVHFSGHGEANGALVVVGADGQPHEVSVQALAALFSAVNSPVRIVVLNACFSEPQAQMLADVVGCAIGMDRPISDEGARIFSGAFYRALAYRRSVAESYEQGCAALGLQGKTKETLTPKLHKRAGVDPALLVLCVRGSANPDVPPAPRAAQVPTRVTVTATAVAALPAHAVRLLGRAVIKAAPAAARGGATATVSASGTTYELRVLQSPARDRESLQSLLHELEMMDGLEIDLRFVKQQQLTPFAQYTPYFGVQEAKRTEELAQHDLLLRAVLRLFCE